jgi:hypothetical protein
MTVDESERGSSPYPLSPIYIDKKNRSNLTNLTNLINDNLLRSNCSFYLSTNINSAWRQYCHLSGKGGCWLIEEALIDYMRRNPLPQVNLSVTQDLAAYAPTMRDRLRNKILKEKITSVLATLRRVRDSGKGDHGVFRKQLQKLVLQATNLKRPDDELMELLREAENFL